MTLNSPMSMRQINYANRLIYYDLKLLTVYQHQIHLSIATGLPTKNETSETIGRNLLSMVSYIQGSL